MALTLDVTLKSGRLKYLSVHSVYIHVTAQE